MRNGLVGLVNALVFASMMAAAGCNSSSSGGGTDGSSSSRGQADAGTGGSSNSGGQTDAGSGGSSSGGGQTDAGTGGSSNSGGQTDAGTGGSSSSGGSTGQGDAASGGSSGSGGAASADTGGSSSSGGQMDAGTGGSSNSGGSVGQGGAASGGSNLDGPAANLDSPAPDLDAAANLDGPTADLDGPALDAAANLDGPAPRVDGGAGSAVDGSTCPATGPVCIGNSTDDFSSGTLAPYWAPWDTCGTTSVSAGALVLDRPAACTGSLGAVLDTCNFEVCGDFDTQVDFALKNFTIPATASRYAGMNVHSLAGATPAWNVTVERLDSSYINFNVPQQQNYKGYTTSSEDASSTFVATADTSGRFRITRVGTTLTAYYWHTSAWVPITATSAPADPMLVIGVYAGGTDPTALTVTFDNFSIASTP